MNLSELAREYIPVGWGERVRGGDFTVLDWMTVLLQKWGWQGEVAGDICIDNTINGPAITAVEEPFDIHIGMNQDNNLLYMMMGKNEGENIDHTLVSRLVRDKQGWSVDLRGDLIPQTKK